jgi:hypothetical protein
LSGEQDAPAERPRVDAAERDVTALELRAAGASFRGIADRLSVSVSTAWKCVDRGLAATRQEPSGKLERERLDRLTVEAVQVLQAHHVVVSGGKIVVDDDTGRPCRGPAALANEAGVASVEPHPAVKLVATQPGLTNVILADRAIKAVLAGPQRTITDNATATSTCAVSCSHR